MLRLYHVSNAAFLGCFLPQPPTMKKLIQANYVILLVSILAIGCQGSNKEIAALYSKMDSLQRQNSVLLERIKSIDSTKPSGLSDTFVVNTKSQTKYCFVVLSVSQIEPVWGKTEYYFYSTAIKEYDYVDEDTKYRLMDAAQQGYLSSWPAVEGKGRVRERKCFVFDSYEQASKEREKYLLDKQ
jgi:hypothetical protein